MKKVRMKKRVSRKILNQGVSKFINKAILNYRISESYKDSLWDKTFKNISKQDILMKNIPEQQKCFKSSVTSRSIYERGGLNNQLPSMGSKSMN